MGQLGLFTRTSTLLCLVLAFSHTLCCSYLRACGHRAYLLFFLCSGLWCECFAAAECAPVYVRPSYHASFRGVGGLRWFVFVWRCHGYPIRPYHIHGVGDLRSVRVDREMGRLGLFTRTSTLLCLVLAFCHTLCCSYLRACGHRAPGIPLVLLVLGFLVCVFCGGGVRSGVCASLIPCCVPRCWRPLALLVFSGSLCACCGLRWRAVPSSLWCASLMSYHISLRSVDGL